MSKSIKMTIVAILLLVFVCSAVCLAATGDVWLGGYLLLKIRCPSGGYTIEQRANALQQRANDLLYAGKGTTKFTVKKSGKDSVVYADKAVFVTVTVADAKTNGTTPGKLANTWAERLRTLLPKATPDRPTH